jgi:hypothetical protein
MSDSKPREDWIIKRGFKFPERGEELCCDAAESFDSWCQTLVKGVESERSAVAINQAKLMLQDHYWHWQQQVHRSHRYRVSDRYRCIYWIYGHYYWRLRELELKVVPLSTLIAPPPPKRPMPTSYLGFEDD